MSNGAELRDDGASRVSDNTPGWWRNKCDAAIAQLAAKGQPFTADDVRAVTGDPPNHPNAMGARFLTAARSKLIERVGYKRPARASRHSCLTAVWQGVK